MKRGVTFTLLSLLLVFALAGAVVAQTGVGRAGFLLLERLDIEINHTLLPGLRVSQLGTGAAIRAEGDVYVADTVSGGDLTYLNTISGVPQISFVAMGTGTNGATETVNYMADAITGGSSVWTAINARSVVTLDTTEHYRVGAKSMKIAFLATAVDADGATDNIVNDDLGTADDSVGYWILSSEALDAGDLDFVVQDDGVTTQYDSCAVPMANQWVWCEIDISALAGANSDVVETVKFYLQDAAGHAAFNVWIDGMWKWDAADEEALGLSIAESGVLGVVSVVTHENQPNTQLVLTAQTNYFVNYESGVDFLVWITDQSASSATALVAYR